MPDHAWTLAAPPHPLATGSADFVRLMAQFGDLLAAKALLAWDARVMMPPAGAADRARQIATLTLFARERLLAPEMADALAAAEAEAAPDSLAAAQCAAARAAIDHHTRVPASIVARRAELGTLGQEVWAEARAASDFARFRPVLEETVALARALGTASGDGAPYEALVRRFEPGESLAGLHALFARLRTGLGPLMAALAERPRPPAGLLTRPAPVSGQRRLAEALAARIGYDFGRGRLDATVHPFATTLTAADVRITTRYDPGFWPSSLFGALHEAGHGLYEQAIDPGLTGTPLGLDLVRLQATGAAGFGVHESQARLWENLVGRSRSFWEAVLPEARAALPEVFDGVGAEEVWRAVNRVAPGLIRTEADELSYDFHIMLRFELEAALIDGSLAVRDLPAAWSDGMRAAFGLDVLDDARGVLQDVHWAGGEIGYFPSYTIGNVMGAQLHAAAAAEPAVADGLSRGEYAPLGRWLGDTVHRHGRCHDREALLVRATGSGLDPEPYIAYLGAKYGEIYRL